jgi:hypothetical protein
MSKARDIANILSASTSIATDAEVTSAVTAAVSTHATAANGHIGRGITANRPVSPSVGDLYFDTTLNALIGYSPSGWAQVSQDPAPQIASISPTTAATTGTTITITGSSFKSALSVQFIGTNAISYNSPVSTFVNATTATATTPNLPVAYEPYDIKLINNDNQFAILENALDSGGTPVWNTASGTIATINEQTALSVSVSATDPDGTSIVYSSSNLPSWISLNSSTGALTGTSPDISSNTTYSFDITASDGLNTSSRSFNVISILPPLLTEYLVVGGGGAGGNGSGGGGGGAGGYRSGTLTLSTATSYSISVGNGGTGSASSLRGNSGAQSQFASIFASGGGGGGTEGDVASGVRAGASGGSGGGGCYINTSPAGAGGSGNSGGYSPSEGNNGGTGAVAGGSNYGGGGGGGSGSVGSNAPGAGAGGNGGSGTSNSITGTTLFYAAGGGGGAQNSNVGATPGSGGSGIGGTGGVYNGAASTPGVVNTGSGGGGGAYYGSNPTGAPGSSGGSGIVVFKYPSSYSISQSGSLTLSTSTAVSGYKITSVTAGSGTVTFNG